jgi:hypothetical protein
VQASKKGQQVSLKQWWIADAVMNVMLNDWPTTPDPTYLPSQPSFVIRGADNAVPIHMFSVPFK